MPDRRIGGRAQIVEQKRDLILFDEAAHLFHRLRRAVAVIQ